MPDDFFASQLLEPRGQFNHGGHQTTPARILYKNTVSGCKRFVAGERVLRDGQPAQEVHALAEEQGADLIVLGTHGRHGFSLLLGSTANAVLHGAKTDVLAVRVGL